MCLKRNTDSILPPPINNGIKSQLSPFFVPPREMRKKIPLSFHPSLLFIEYDIQKKKKEKLLGCHNKYISLNTFAK